MYRNNNANYRSIGSFGGNVDAIPSNNPLSYTLLASIDSQFNHGQMGQQLGPNTKHGQIFMAQYCASNFDGFCEFASKNQNKTQPNNIQPCGSESQVACQDLNAGEVLIGNTARKKYLTEMSGNCELKYEPFDPTVASSPLISFWQSSCNSQGTSCIPVYEVNPKTIDSDIVMQKILRKPIIALDVLINIYNTAVRKNTINQLKGTKIMKFFESKTFQDYIKRKKILI